MCWSIRRSYILNMYLCVWSMFEQSWPDFGVRPNNTNWPQGHYLRNEFQTSPGWTLYTGLKNKLLRSGSVCSHPPCWLSIMDTLGHTNIIKNVSVWGFIFSTCPSFVIFDSSEIMATIKQNTSAFNTNRNYVVSPSYNLVNNLVSLWNFNICVFLDLVLQYFPTASHKLVWYACSILCLEKATLQTDLGETAYKIIYKQTGTANNAVRNCSKSNCSCPCCIW